jgi:hypothetical protein
MTLSGMAGLGICLVHERANRARVGAVTRGLDLGREERTVTGDAINARSPLMNQTLFQPHQRRGCASGADGSSFAVLFLPLAVASVIRISL